MDAAVQEIYKELEERVAFFQANNQLIEAQRIKQRTMYDADIYASNDEVYLLKRELLYQENTFGLSLVYCSISLQNLVDSLYLYAWFISYKDTK